MSIEHQYNKVMLICDECGESSEEKDKDDFSTLIKEAKADGWAIIKEGDEWIHACPSCSS